MAFYDPARLQFRKVVRSKWKLAWSQRLRNWLRSFEPADVLVPIKPRPHSHGKLVARQRKARGRYGRHA